MKLSCEDETANMYSQGSNLSSYATDLVIFTLYSSAYCLYLYESSELF